MRKKKAHRRPTDPIGPQQIRETKASKMRKLHTKKWIEEQQILEALSNQEEAAAFGGPREGRRYYYYGEEDDYGNGFEDEEEEEDDDDDYDNRSTSSRSVSSSSLSRLPSVSSQLSAMSLMSTSTKNNRAGAGGFASPREDPTAHFEREMANDTYRALRQMKQEQRDKELMELYYKQNNGESSPPLFSPSLSLPALLIPSLFNSLPLILSSLRCSLFVL